MTEDSGESVDYRAKLKSLKDNAKSRRNEKTVRLMQEALRREGLSAAVNTNDSTFQDAIELSDQDKRDLRERQNK